MINQLAMLGLPSSSTVTDNETDNDFWTMVVHELIIKPITSWLPLVMMQSQTGSQHLHKASAIKNRLIVYMTTLTF